MAESQQQKLNRVRKPRVHITYEVETEGAQVVKELPFVVGVMGDFSGDPTSKLKPLKDRKFIQIDRDNFNDDVLQRMTPGLNMRVENTLAGDGSEMSVNLEFQLDGGFRAREGRRASRAAEEADGNTRQAARPWRPKLIAATTSKTCSSKCSAIANN